MPQSQKIILIAAVAQNRVIGANGVLPFHLPADLARFKRLTQGKTVLMGRKTYESLPPNVRPLPGRTNLVLTRQRAWQPHPAVQVIHHLDDLPILPELWVIGGAELYTQLLPRATRLELTEVHAPSAGDAYFPAFNRTEWREASRTANPGRPPFDFVTYLRA